MELLIPTCQLALNFRCIVSQTSPYRQCRCVFRDHQHLARVEDLLQRLLECAIHCICELRVPAVEDGKKSTPVIDDEAGRKTDVDSENSWTQAEKERLFLAVGKIFQLPFPFYQVRKIPLLRQVCARISEVLFTSRKLVTSLLY